MDSPHDPGLQNERTSLAWSRTALALVVAVLLAVRITLGELGLLAVVFTIFTLPLAVGVLVSAARRYRTARHSLHARETFLPDARLPAAVTVLVLSLAVIELAYMYVR
jgi:putative membrane protein